MGNSDKKLALCLKLISKIVELIVTDKRNPESFARLLQNVVSPTKKIPLSVLRNNLEPLDPDCSEEGYKNLRSKLLSILSGLDQSCFNLFYLLERGWAGQFVFSLEGQPHLILDDGVLEGIELWKVIPITLQGSDLTDYVCILKMTESRGSFFYPLSRIDMDS